MTPVTPTATLHLHLAGWSSSPHSIALVNQWQALALAKRPDVRLTRQDIPMPTPPDDVFSAGNRQRLDAIPALTDGLAPLCELRTPFAPDGQSADHPVLGFVVNEMRGEGFRVKLGPPEARRGYRQLFYNVPSDWCRVGLIEAGAPEERIFVIPHGVDVRTFRPTPGSRDRIRRQLGLARFTFMHVGGMVLSKGIDLLLRAFATLLQRGLPVQLLLKGQDAIYQSQQALAWMLGRLSEAQRVQVLENLLYIGKSYDMPTMAAIYGAADAYVAPYRAEGFCLPALEAAACGLPVIATSGGATDDFTNDTFCWGVASQYGAIEGEGCLEPDLDHLIELMSRMVTARDFHNRASKAGPRHVAANYTWDHVAGRIVDTVRGMR